MRAIVKREFNNYFFICMNNFFKSNKLVPYLELCFAPRRRVPALPDLNRLGPWRKPIKRIQSLRYIDIKFWKMFNNLLHAYKIG